MKKMFEFFYFSKPRVMGIYTYTSIYVLSLYNSTFIVYCKADRIKRFVDPKNPYFDKSPAIFTIAEDTSHTHIRARYYYYYYSVIP